MTNRPCFLPLPKPPCLPALQTRKPFLVITCCWCIQRERELSNYAKVQSFSKSESPQQRSLDSPEEFKGSREGLPLRPLTCESVVQNRIFFGDCRATLQLSFPYTGLPSARRMKQTQSIQTQRLPLVARSCLNCLVHCWCVPEPDQ